MKKLIFSVLFIILLSTSACVNKPYDYLAKRDYDGLKKEVLRNPNFIKRKNCRKEDYYCKNRNYFSVVDYLSMYGFIDEVEDAKLLEFLIKNGAAITNKGFTKYYREPLYRALRNKRNIIAKVLIENNPKGEQGFDINKLTHNNTSALSIASVQRNNKDMIKYIISKGGDINKENIYKTNPLELALSIPDNQENIEEIIKSGFVIKDSKKLKFNPNFIKNLRVLIEYNIPILNMNDYVYYYNYRYKYKTTDLSVTLKKYLSSIEAGLSLGKNDYLKNIHILTFIKDNISAKKAIDLCLKTNKDCKKYLNSFSYFGYSPIVLAAYNNNFDLMEYLLKNGAEINLKNKFLQTPLHLLILMKNKKAIQFLLKNNADITIKDIKGNTAKDLYKEYFNEDIDKLIPKVEEKTVSPLIEENKESTSTTVSDTKKEVSNPKVKTENPIK